MKRIIPILATLLLLLQLLIPWPSLAPGQARALAAATSPTATPAATAQATTTATPSPGPTASAQPAVSATATPTPAGATKATSTPSVSAGAASGDTSKSARYPKPRVAPAAPQKQPSLAGPNTPSRFATGDVFAGIGGAQIKRFSSGGAYLATLNTNASNNYDTGMAFDRSGNLYATNFDKQSVSKFDSSGNYVGTFGSGYDSIPESMVFDRLGNAYVGQAREYPPVGSGRVLRFNAGGSLTGTYNVAAEWNGSDWIDLEADGCTLLYTSEGAHVKSYNVCSSQQNGDFADLHIPPTDGTTNQAFAIRIRNNSEVLVAAHVGTSGEVFRLNSSGGIMQTYTLSNEYFHGLSLDPDGNTFWVGGFTSGNVYHYDINSGSLLGQIGAGPVNSALGAVVVFGTPTTQTSPPGGVSFGPLQLAGATSNDPVNTFTGNAAYTRTDLAIAGRGPSPVFARAYNSMDTRTGPLGPGWTHSYNIHLANPGDGSLDLLLVGPQGRTDRYTHNADGSYTPPPAVYTTLVWNVDNTYTATLPDQSTWFFDGGGLLRRTGDRYGNVSTLSYNASSQLTSVSDPAGRGSLTFGYNGSGLLSSVTDWANRSVQFGYDGNGRLQTVHDRNNQLTTYGYDGTTSHLTTITDANNHVALTMTYDGQGRVQTQKDAMGLTTGQQTSFSYPPSEPGTTTVTYPATSFDGAQPTVADTYDAQGRLTQRVSHPSSSENYTVAYTYDANYNRTSATDGRGNTTTFCWDVDYTGVTIPTSHGNLTRTVSPPPGGGSNPLVTLFKYDGKNNLLETVRPKGVNNGGSVSCVANLAGSVSTLYATDNAYDGNGVFLLSTSRRYTDPDLGQQTAVTKYEYNDSANPGRVTRVIPPRGNTGGNPDYSYATTMTYYGSGSQAGMLQTAADALGNHSSYSYDAVGRKLSMVDPMNSNWQWAYDNEDRVTSTTAPAPASGGSPLVTQYRYDAVGNRTVVIDANGQVTKYLFDVRDGLAEVDQSPNPWTDPNANPSPKYVTTYSYDNLGNMSRMTRAAGDSANERATGYAYDGLNRLRAETQYPSWPSTSGPLVTQYAYDANGNQTGLTKPDGTVLTSTFDALNRWTGRNNPQVSYSFDADSNRSSMADATGTTSYSYDELDRLLAVTSPGPNTVGYRYDLDGNRAKTIYPDGTAVADSYDKADRLSQLVDWASRSTSYGYFADGLVQQVTNVDGTTAKYTYDNARQLTQVLNQKGTATISQHSYTLDAVGNRLQASELLPSLPGGGFAPIRGGASGAGGTAPKGGPTATPTPSVPTSPAIPSAQGHAGKPGHGKPPSEGGNPGAAPPAGGGVSPLTSPAVQDPWAWGYNGNGQLGNGTTASASTPAQISGLGQVVSLAGGRYHSVAAKTDGTVWAFGYNGDGELGDGTTTQRQTPVQTSGMSGATQVAGAETHSMALKNDGTVWAWGWNGNGQLGDGTTNQHLTPNQIPNLSNVTAIAAGGWHSLALKSDGTVWAWGLNIDGEVGDGTTTDRSSPVQVVGLSNVTAIAAGRYDSMALKSDGTVWMWGFNGNGQLGDGTTTSRSTPVQVSGLGGVAAISAGEWHSLAAKQDGSVWAWGFNGNGELGDGTTTQRQTPVQSQGMSGATAVGAGTPHSLAVKNDGSVWAWGYNGDGELGDGTTTNHLTPEQAGGASGMAGITLDATGAWHNLATAGPGTVVTSYGYDRLYELTSVLAPGLQNGYTYDPVGNRTAVTGSDPGTFSYDKSDRLGGNYITDANGNLYQGPPGQFFYDAANRMTKAQASGQGQGVTYVYDGDGDRVARNTVQYPGYQYNVADVFDPNSALPVVLQENQNGSGPNGPFNITTKYVYGLGLAYGVDNSNNVTVDHTDGLGSVRALTDGTGTVTQTYRTDAFGQVTGSQGQSLQPFGFAGEATDPESGLVYLRARAYSPALGRFMQRDPVVGSPAAPLSLNRYSYVGNNPASAIDPSGQLTFFIGGIGGPNNPDYGRFVTALQGPPTNLVNVRPVVPAFTSGFCQNLVDEVAQATCAAIKPSLDASAQALTSQIKRDPELERVLLGEEQLNLIGYSGGATVAFDTAVELQRYGIPVDNIVTLGGVVLRGKPGNVGQWTAIIGTFDFVAANAALPDELVYVWGVTHRPTRLTPSYLTGGGRDATLQIISQIGLQ